jgi:hypothetical protein
VGFFQDKEMLMDPFKTEMVRMQMPEDGGSNLSVEGFMLAADKDGCVDVPLRLVESLKSHGLTVPGAKPAKK